MMYRTFGEKNVLPTAFYNYCLRTACAVTATAIVTTPGRPSTLHFSKEPPDFTGKMDEHLMNMVWPGRVQLKFFEHLHSAAHADQLTAKNFVFQQVETLCDVAAQPP